MSILDIFKRKKEDNKDIELSRALESITTLQNQLDTRMFELFKDRPVFVAPGMRLPINLEHLFQVQRTSRYLVRTVPEGIAYVRNMVNYAIGSEPVFTLITDNRRNKALLKAIDRVNNLSSLLIEAAISLFEDGEVFIRVKPNGLVPELSIIPPERVRPPSTAIEPGWEFGVKTDPDNWRKIEKYCIYNHDNSKHEIVDAKYVYHLFNNTGHKRGYPSLAGVFDELSDLPAFRAAGRKGEAARQAISFIRQHAKATQQDLSAFSTLTAGRDLEAASKTSKHFPLSQILPGSIVDVPEGLESVDPPSVKSPTSHDIQLQSTIYAVGAATGVPDWVFGRPMQGTFNAALTAESPFIKTLEFHQGTLVRLFINILNAAANIGGGIDTDTDDFVAITLPNPQSREFKTETEALSIMHRDSVISKQTYAAWSGFNYKEEKDKINKEEPTAVEIDTRDDDNPDTPN